MDNRYILEDVFHIYVSFFMIGFWRTIETIVNELDFAIPLSGGIMLDRECRRYLRFGESCMTAFGQAADGCVCVIQVTRMSAIEKDDVFDQTTSGFLFAVSKTVFLLIPRFTGGQAAF